MKTVAEMKAEKKKMQRRRLDEGCSYPEWVDLTEKIGYLNKKIKAAK